MRAAAILGPGAKERDLKPFRAGAELVTMPEIQAADHWDAVLVLGGDGTVHRHLAALRESQAPLLVVPAGSGNDFARALRLQTVRRAWGAWRKFCCGAGNVRAIDLGMIRQVADGRQTYFCCIGGAGLDAETNRCANRMPAALRAHGGYVLAALREISRYDFPLMRVEINRPTPAQDGQMWSTAVHLEERATLVAFANANSYGHGMRMAPRARLDDGLLDVCFVRRTSRLRLLRFFPTVFTGGHLHLPEVEYVQARSLRVECDPSRDVYADGEYVCRTPVEVTVESGGLRVIV